MQCLCFFKDTLKSMGLVYPNINLTNPVKPELKSIDVRCLADSVSPMPVLFSLIFENANCFVGALIIGDEVLLALCQWKTWTL